MDDFLTVFGSAELLNAHQVALGLLMSFILSALLAAVYAQTFRGFSYSRTFVHTLILSSLVVAMLIMAIGNNLARGLGILGTLAIVRFRTPVRDPRDLVFLFATLGVGIACGAHVFTVAVVGTLFIAGAALLLHASPFASRREYEGMLRFSAPPNAPIEADLRALMERCCSSFSLLAMRESAQGDLVEWSYHVRLLDPSYQGDLVNGMHAIKDVADASLLMHRVTVEL